MGKTGKPRKPPKAVVTLDPTDAKARLRQELSRANFRNGVATKPAVVQEINQAIEEVESLDSTENPATTGAGGLTGKWQLLYSTADAIPGGALGPFFGEVTHKLDTRRQAQTMEYSFLGGAFKMDWTHEYRVTSSYEWELPQEDWVPVFFGVRFSLWSFSTLYKSKWQLTYTDPDFRIIRASAPDKRRRAGNEVYVLAREQ